MTDTTDTARILEWLDAHGTPEAHAARDALERLAAENAELRKDAGRWRHFPMPHVRHVLEHLYSHTFVNCTDDHIRDIFGRYIDAAMAEGNGDE